MMKRLRKLLGIEKFEMPDEPTEFTHLRPIIESHISGGWSMGKAPENPAIVVQLTGKTVPPLLEQHLKKTAEQHGFEVEVSASGFHGLDRSPSNMAHMDSINWR